MMKSFCRVWINLNVSVLPLAYPRHYFFDDTSKFLNLPFYWSFPQVVGERKNSFRRGYFSKTIIQILISIANNCFDVKEMTLIQGLQLLVGKYICSEQQLAFKYYLQFFYFFSNFQHKYQNVAQFQNLRYLSISMNI